MAAIVVATIGTTSAVTAATPAAAASGPCGTSTATPAYQHVIWIWMENHSLGDIIGNTSQAPYINTLAGECGLATNYHNLSHPSLPNYVGATSGLAVSSLTPFDPDCNPTGSCLSTAPSIFGQGDEFRGVRRPAQPAALFHLPERMRHLGRSVPAARYRPGEQRTPCVLVRYPQPHR
jgi:hypothetical protein